MDGKKESSSVMWFLKSWEETGGQDGRAKQTKMLIQQAREQAATRTN